MKKLVGQFMRLAGIVVEMLGVWVVMSGNKGVFDRNVNMPGLVKPIPLPLIAFAVGFALWLVGTVLVYSSRRSRQSLRPEIEETPSS